MKRWLMIPATLLTLAATGADQRIPEATPDGEPVNCIRASQIDRTVVHSDSVIDFHMKGRKVYRNELPSACPGLGFNRTIQYEVRANDLCSVDTITVLETPGLMRGATCGLGTFQPVTLTPAN